VVSNYYRQGAFYSAIVVSMAYYAVHNSINFSQFIFLTLLKAKLVRPTVVVYLFFPLPCNSPRAREGGGVHLTCTYATLLRCRLINLSSLIGMFYAQSSRSARRIHNWQPPTVLVIIRDVIKGGGRGRELSLSPPQFEK